MMTEQVFAQAAALLGQPESGQAELLRLLCRANAAALQMRLKDGLTVEDCQEEFVMAASLFALAALKDAEKCEEFRAGDLTVKAGTGREADALREQAEALMKPYLKDCFAFVGV